MEEFKIGDKVKLKSGGPDMTINDKNPDEHDNIIFLCQWFDGSKLNERWFPPESLEKI